MHIDWNALGEVAVVSIALAVGVVVIFTLGVLALSHSETETDTDHGRNATLALTSAMLCFAACATVALYSIYLIIPPLHH